MFLSVNPVFHACTKHIEVVYHFVHDKVAKKEIRVQLISLKDQLTNVPTKSLPHALFAHLGYPSFEWNLFL
jgi:histone deacetylase 1/2